jgi:Fe-S cluster assembly protein SufD
MSSLTVTENNLDLFLQETARQEELYGERMPAITGIRENAANAFQKLGIPTQKHEEWKYTNLSAILKTPLRIAHPEEPQVLDAKYASQFVANNSVVVVIENGRINNGASGLNNLPEGVMIGSLEKLSEDVRVKAHLGKHADIENESFVALNTALLRDGVAILVDANVNAGRIINLVFVATSAEAMAIQSRILVVAGESSSCTIIEQHVTSGNALPHFNNVVAETVCGRNAKLEYVKLQDTDDRAMQINFHQAVMERDSRFHITTLTLNGALVRNNLHIRLNDQNCEAHLNGLYVINGNQLVDNHTLVDHAFPNCYSNELYKGIIDDKGQGVFNGKIFVRRDAQKTNAYQSNKNILLSNDASMNTKPQLEIYADDVKCSHGATTGQLDDEALFYLRSRGIGEQSARALLNHAFAADVIEQINNENIRSDMLNRLDRKLE